MAERDATGGAGRGRESRIELDAGSGAQGDRTFVYHGHMRIPTGWWAVQPAC